MFQTSTDKRHYIMLGLYSISVPYDSCFLFQFELLTTFFTPLTYSTGLPGTHHEVDIVGKDLPSMCIHVCHITISYCRFGGHFLCELLHVSL